MGRPDLRTKGLASLAVALWIVFACATPAWSAVSWPLRVSASGRYLEDQSGVPFVVVGDSPWSMTVHLSPTQMDTYFNDRAARGFTAVIVRAIDTFGDRDDYAGNRPFPNNSDWSVRNEAYWQTLDMLLNKAKAKDMVVLLAPAYLGWGCGSQGWCAEMQAQTDTAMYQYGQWIATRYRNQGNIIWVDGGDADAALYPNALSRVRNVADGIKSVLPNVLHTAHAGRNNRAATTYTWIDIYSPYSECTNTPLRVKEEYDRRPIKPLLYIEGQYENEGADVTCMAAQSLWTYLGGGAGANFGNYPIWDFGAGWNGTVGIGSTGSQQQSHIGNLMRSRAWWRLETDYSNIVVAGNRGEPSWDSYVPAARTSDGETVMAYIPASGTQITVDMTKIAGSQAKAWWFNPETAGTTLIGTYPTTGSHTFTSAASNRVLVLDNDAVGLPAPGTTVYSMNDVPPSPTSTESSGGGGGCFIATAAYGSPLAAEVRQLREVRDRYLISTPIGQHFVAIYYQLTPPLATLIAQSPALQAFTRAALMPVLAWAALILWSPFLGLTLPLAALSLGGLGVVHWRRRRRG
jgi:hypothetical protein